MAPSIDRGIFDGADIKVGITGICADLCDDPSEAALHELLVSARGCGEHAAGEPTPWTGQYLEEVISDGAPRPVWRFE